MRRSQSASGLSTPIDGMRNIHCTGLDQFANGLTLNPFHSDEQARGRVSGFENRDNVGMVQRRGCAGFGLEAVNCLWARYKMAAQDLERNRDSRTDHAPDRPRPFRRW